MQNLESSFLQTLNNDQVQFISQTVYTPRFHCYRFTFRSKRNKLFHFNIQMTEKDTITFTFNGVGLTKEVRLAASKITHKIKQHFESKKEVRLRIVTGQLKTKFGHSVIENIEEFEEQNKKRRSGTLKKTEVLAMKEDLLSLYHETKQTLVEKYERSFDDRNVLLVKGREANYLVHLLKEIGIADFQKWDQGYSLQFHLDEFKSDPYSLRYFFAKELKKRGFRAWVHSWIVD